MFIHGDTFPEILMHLLEFQKKNIYHQPTLALREIVFHPKWYITFSVVFSSLLIAKKKQYKVGHLIPRRATKERCRKIRFLHRLF